MARRRDEIWWLRKGEKGKEIVRGREADKATSNFADDLHNKESEDGND
jgi:hypothetical protein